jgi:hypothetical protein
MKTAAEYRAMAEECFKWAREARTSENRVALRQLAQIWLDTASKLEETVPTQPATPDNSPKTAA